VRVASYITPRVYAQTRSDVCRKRRGSRNVINMRSSVGRRCDHVKTKPRLTYRCFAIVVSGKQNENKSLLELHRGHHTERADSMRRVTNALDVLFTDRRRFRSALDQSMYLTKCSLISGTYYAFCTTRAVVLEHGRSRDVSILSCRVETVKT